MPSGDTSWTNCSIWRPAVSVSYSRCNPPPLKRASRVARADVLASNNRGKIAELSEILAPYGVVVHPLSRFTAESADETGSTYHANALLKARFAAKVAQLPAIADDSGIEVDALNGAPGVFSARFSGPGATDLANNRSE